MRRGWVLFSFLAIILMVLVAWGTHKWDTRQGGTKPPAPMEAKSIGTQTVFSSVSSANIGTTAPPDPSLANEKKRLCDKAEAYIAQAWADDKGSNWVAAAKNFEVAYAIYLPLIVHYPDARQRGSLIPSWLEAEYSQLNDSGKSQMARDARIAILSLPDHSFTEISELPRATKPAVQLYALTIIQMVDADAP